MKQYILNPTPVRTANNFGINDIKIDLEIPEIRDFNGFRIEDNNDLFSYEVKDESKEIDNRIGLSIKSNKIINIKVDDGKKFKEPVRFIYKFDDDTLVDSINIEIGKNTDAKFIFVYEGSGFHFLKQKIYMAEYGRAEIVIANLLSENSDSFIAIENELADESKLSHTLVEFGGSNKISNYYTRQVGYHSENNLNTIYLGKNKEKIDINYLIEQYGKKSKCNINVQGALNENAEKHFKGFIDFKEGAKGSKGDENENCTLLSDSAISRSLPVLLCHEEDVEGTHGVSTGKIDEKKLFYIMTKGFSYDEAKRLIVKANFNKILKTIPYENLVNCISKVIDEI